MSPLRTAAVGVGFLALAGLGLLAADQPAADDAKGEVVDVDVRRIGDALKTLDPQKEVALEPSKLAALPDGGIAYAVEALIADGGVELRKVPPGCVRRPTGVKPSECQRTIADLVGRAMVVDPGELNRFPVAEAVGAGCQPVACSVYAGDDADADEAARVRDDSRGGAR